MIPNTKLHIPLFSLNFINYYALFIFGQFKKKCAIKCNAFAVAISGCGGCGGCGWVSVRVFLWWINFSISLNSNVMLLNAYFKVATGARQNGPAQWINLNDLIICCISCAKLTNKYHCLYVCVCLSVCDHAMVISSFSVPNLRRASDSHNMSTPSCDRFPSSLFGNLSLSLSLSLSIVHSSFPNFSPFLTISR